MSDFESLVSTASMDLSRERRTAAMLGIVDDAPPRKAIALLVRIFEAHRTSPWKSQLEDELRPFIAAATERRAARVLCGLLGRWHGFSDTLARALIQIGDASVVPTLIAVLGGNAGSEATDAAMKSLAELGDASVVMALRKHGGEVAEAAIANIQARVGGERGSLSTQAGGELSLPYKDRP